MVKKSFNLVFSRLVSIKLNSGLVSNKQKNHLLPHLSNKIKKTINPYRLIVIKSIFYKL